MIQKLKKWNWNIFWTVFAIACLGATSNDTIHTLADGVILAVGATLIFGLPMAYITRNEDKV